MTIKVSTKVKTPTRKVSSLKDVVVMNPTLDSELVEKAVRAVLKYHEKKTQESAEKLSLLGNERPVQVQFTLLRAPGKSKPKPFQIVVPHPFFKEKRTFMV